MLGKRVRVPLDRTRIRRIGNRTGSYRLYGDYTIPDDVRVPEELRGAKIKIRLSRSKHAGKYNRAEHYRGITVHDPVIGDDPDPDHASLLDQLYVPRPGAESANRWLKHHFADKRAPAVGRHRITFMMIAAQLRKNVKSAIVHRQRLELAA